MKANSNLMKIMRTISDSQSIVTLSTAQSLIRSFRDADDWLYIHNENNFDNIFNILSDQAGDILRSYCEEKDVNTKDMVELHKALQRVIDDIENRQKVTIVTAIQLNLEFVTLVHDFLSRALSSAIVIETHVDKSILGGIKVYWKGLYIDLSLQPQLSKAFTQS